MSMKCEYYKEDFNHSYSRRKKGHDYYSPCRYHIVIKKKKDFENFGKIIGDAKIAPGNEGCADIKLNKFGKVINDCIFKLPHQFPALKIYQHKVMPDHVHIFLQVKERTGHHLGYYIKALKANIGKGCSSITGKKLCGDDIFQSNYTDKIIYWGSDFNIIYNYIRENPHRLAMVIQYPEFFQRENEIKIGDKIYSAYGSLFLLKNPFKSAVRIHRKNSAEENENLRNEWLRTADNGGVLVSPFISKREKMIRDEAESLGGNFILIQDKPFPEIFKPSKHNFELCCRGRLLIIAPTSPYEYDSFRKTCLDMNALAELIARGDLNAE